MFKFIGLAAKHLLDTRLRSRLLPRVLCTVMFIGALLTVGSLYVRKSSSFLLPGAQLPPPLVDGNPRNLPEKKHSAAVLTSEDFQTAINSRATNHRRDLAVIKSNIRTPETHFRGIVDNIPKHNNNNNNNDNNVRSTDISNNKINLIEYFNLSSKLSPPQNVNRYFDCTTGILLQPDEVSSVKDWDSLSIQRQPYTVASSGYLGCRLSDEDMRSSNRTSAVIVKVAKSVNRYVSFTSGFLDGRGIGNQLFNLASMVHVAQLTGRKPAILPFRNRIGLDDVFVLGPGGSSDVIERRRLNLCPSLMFVERCSLAYDDRVERLVSDYGRSIESASIFLNGFFQSWKYVHPVDRLLRTRYLVFQPEVAESATRFLSDGVPVAWRKTKTTTHARGGVTPFVRVGIHVRRGDVMTADKIAYGYTTPNETYYRRAMLYFVERYRRVQFVVCGNNVLWMREVFTRLVGQIASAFSPSTVSLILSEYQLATVDLAILASCDHVIMSTGTFGWWGAWLAGGTTIYYANWPKPESPLSTTFRREDFFPPEWIGLE